MIESTTAIKHGWGRDHYRWVSGLTPNEREAVDREEMVYFRITPWHPSQSGYKIVFRRWSRHEERKGHFDSREPTPVELEILKGL